MFGTRSNKPFSSEGQTYQVQLENFIGTYAGAAVAVNADGDVLSANKQADVFLDLLDSMSENPLSSIIQQTRDQNQSISERITLQAEIDTLVYQVHTMPIVTQHAPDVVLIMARDMTADRNIVDALVASRELFKDLVACSSDFAWETDADGRFTYVSKQGALGFVPADLVGKKATILQDEHDESLFPFLSHKPVEDYEIWLRAVNSGRAFCRVSSRPIIVNGELMAVRGVSRDITDEYYREAELERRRMQEKLLQRIVDALRTEFDPQRLLTTAATLPTQVLNADGCWVFVADQDGKLALNMQYPHEDPQMTIVVEELVKQACDLDDEDLPVEAVIKYKSLIADVTKFRGEINGAIVMIRGVSSPNWTDDERQLVASVAAHLGIALHQKQERQMLERLSKIDDVTGLKNRRAFMEELELRFSHIQRYKRHGVVAYVDLDNFKAVNDVLGHRVGDSVLSAMAQILQDGQRAGDLAARIGGDEFVVWLEETDIKGASIWANRVLVACRQLKKITLDCTPDVTVSIGLAYYGEGDATDVSGMLHRADAAMYEAKKSGKGAFHIAPPLEQQ